MAYTGPFNHGYTNNGTTTAVIIQNKTTGGNIVNNGIIAPNGISVINSIIEDAIIDNGTIAGGISLDTNSKIVQVGTTNATALKISGASFSGGITNAGVITSGDFAVSVSFVANFSGGLINSGEILAYQGQGTLIGGGSIFNGGITNSGVISSETQEGIFINTQKSFGGGITNGTGATIQAQRSGILVEGLSRFSGGITNNGVISGGTGGLVVIGTISTFIGGITNNGSIVGGAFGIYVGPNTGFRANEAVVNNGDVSVSPGGNAIEVGDPITIDQNAGVVTGDILFAGTDAVLNLAGGAINGNIEDPGGSSIVEQIGSGTTVLTGADNVNGATDIASGTLELGNGGSITHQVTFTGWATLALATGSNQLGGSIVGAVAGDDIDALFVPYSSGIQAQWQQNGATGTLSLVNGGTTLASFTLTGQYTAGNFTIAPDGSGGTLIEVVNPPPPHATAADMIMRDGGNGDYEIYDLGNNAIQAAYALGEASTAYQVADLGGFFGTDTSDMLLRSSTGAFEVEDISNNTVTASVSMGQVGTEWGVAGFGDFSGNPGETDMLMRNSNTGAFEVYDINANAIVNAASMGQVGLTWQVAGFGDFSGHADETGDMLMRNTSTGQFEVYDITNNTLTFAASMGQVGLEWQVAGFGDFSGNVNETDMLMRNSNTGAFEIYDISNNAIYNASSMGQVGLEWQVAGFGPIDGAGASDMLMRNTNTGAFEIYDISHNTIVNASSMGQVGLAWSVGGIAVDPPTSMGAESAQLTQSMASFAPASADSAGSPVGNAAVLASVGGVLSSAVTHPVA